MRVVLHAESIRCVFSVHRGVGDARKVRVSTVCSERHIQFVAQALNSRHPKNIDTSSDAQYPQQKYASLPSTLKASKSPKDCGRPSQESRNSLPSRWREPSSGAAMAGLPATTRVPSPPLPIIQHGL